MKKIVLFLFIIFISFSYKNIILANNFFYDLSKVTDTCKEKWTERGELDERMFQYCMKQQDEGYKDAVYLMENKYQNIPLIDQVLTYAMNKWLTRKEYDYNMVRYEIEEQSEGYLDVKWDLDNGKISDSLFERCKSKWIRTDEPLWRMVRYCTRK
tara:strand:+ start:517 stop:981 length:465 start_codon:yes stop_codon:yes gene_type:complete